MTRRTVFRDPRARWIHAIGTVVLSLAILSACPRIVWSAAGDGAERNAVAWYPFTEGQGSQIHDRSGHHNDGEVVGPYQWNGGNGGLQLDGTAYVRVPSSSSLGLSKDFTLDAWFAG